MQAKFKGCLDFDQPESTIKLTQQSLQWMLTNLAESISRQQQKVIYLSHPQLSHPQHADPKEKAGKKRMGMTKIHQVLAGWILMLSKRNAT